jgi:phosphatidylserine decarboxylase
MSQRRALVFLIVLAAVAASPAHAAGQDKDMSAELQRLVKENPELGKALQHGLDHQLGENCPRCNNPPKSYWHGRTLEQLYQFFKDWQTHVPGADPNPRDGTAGTDKIGDKIGWYDLNFADYVTAPEGYLAVQTPLFRSWMIDFINARKEYLESRESTAYVAQLPETWFNDYIVPDGGFRSWVDFFTRQLKPGMRPFARRNDPCVLNSPADAGFAPASSIVSLPKDIDYPTLRAKGDVLSVREVFNNHPFAARFQGGSVLTFWLEFSNTHWFFAPVDGTVVASGVLAGLYSREFAFQNLPAHKRGFLLVDTQEFGLVGLLVVGLQTVSEIDLTVGAGDAIRKGDTLGRFNYGGSTAMLFYEKGKAKLAESFEQAVKKQYDVDKKKEKNVKTDINSSIEVRIGQEVLHATSSACR